ncbi:MAG TPA: GYD domain-containing protein [Candidatus Acidoferrum sp.]|nr:GYD domain-containing protein [Candidatus Acidoferrum sp.]
MARYIMLVNWTDQGIRNVKDSPKRLDAARNAAKGVGAEIKDFYMTMGDHDLVLVVDAPTDEAMAKLALIQGGAGNVRTKTLKAFSETEYRAIIGSLA